MKAINRIPGNHFYPFAISIYLLITCLQGTVDYSTPTTNSSSSLLRMKFRKKNNLRKLLGNCFLYNRNLRRPYVLVLGFLFQTEMTFDNILKWIYCTILTGYKKRRESTGIFILRWAAMNKLIKKISAYNFSAGIEKSYGNPIERSF